MILEIVIVGISLNFMGCGKVGTAKMIKNRKMKNEDEDEDPCACKDEWSYGNNRIPFWKCQDRIPDDQGKPWCYINGTNNTCKNEIYKNKIEKSKHSDNLFFRNCDWNTEGDPSMKRIRKYLKENSNKYSATGEGGKIDQEFNQTIKGNILKQAEQYNKELFQNIKENTGKEKKNLDNPPTTTNPPTSGGFVSCGVPIEPVNKNPESCLKKKLGNNYDKTKWNQYVDEKKYFDCFFVDNCVSYNKCAEQNKGIEKVNCEE
jgi:hypothetical protein